LDAEERNRGGCGGAQRLTDGAHGKIEALADFLTLYFLELDLQISFEGLNLRIRAGDALSSGSIDRGSIIFGRIHTFLAKIQNPYLYLIFFFGSAAFRN
jgi:hypothetical protein